MESSNNVLFTNRMFLYATAAYHASAIQYLEWNYNVYSEEPTL